MLRLYLVRHGQTDDNEHGRLCGDRDVPLSKTGARMAEALAQALGTVPLDAVYASPTSRARDTARPLAQRKGLTLQVEEGLRELSYGAWEGLTPEEARKQAPEAYAVWMNDMARYAPPGGETAIQVAARARRVIAAIEQRHDGGRVLCVSHKSTIRVLLCSLLDIELRHFKTRLDQPEGAVNVVELSEAGAKLLLLGDTSYFVPLAGRLRREPLDSQDTAEPMP